ncbi:hypothetical protein Tco_1346294, partial [Tanacetum coccineum]
MKYREVHKLRMPLRFTNLICHDPIGIISLWAAQLDVSFFSISKVHSSHFRRQDLSRRIQLFQVSKKLEPEGNLCFVTFTLGDYKSKADPELEAIRQRRMQEMMAQHGGGGSQQNPEQQKAQE